MEVDVKLKVLGIIVACGFAAGFVIEQRASAMVDAPVHGIKMKKREIVDAGDEDDDDEGGSGGPKGGAEKRSNKAGGGEPNGNVSASPASAGGGGGGGKPKEADAKKSASADARPAPQKPPEAIAGRKAMDVVAGNTLKDNGAQTPDDMTFYATRGLVGRRSGEGFVVRKWTMKGDELCETGTAGALACRAIQIRLEGDGKGATGAVIGHIVGANVDIVKGNVADFPIFVPGVEPRPKSRQGFASVSSDTPSPGLSGAAAFQAILGKILVDAKSPASLNLVYFDPEGAMLDVRRASRQGEASVAITAWALKKDALCRDGAGGGKPVCLRPQIIEGGVLRLGTGAGAPTFVETQG